MYAKAGKYDLLLIQQTFLSKVWAYFSIMSFSVSKKQNLFLFKINWFLTAKLRNKRIHTLNGNMSKTPPIPHFLRMLDEPTSGSVTVTHPVGPTNSVNTRVDYNRKVATVDDPKYRELLCSPNRVTLPGGEYNGNMILTQEDMLGQSSYWTIDVVPPSPGVQANYAVLTLVSGSIKLNPVIHIFDQCQNDSNLVSFLTVTANSFTPPINFSISPGYQGDYLYFNYFGINPTSFGRKCYEIRGMSTLNTLWFSVFTNAFTATARRVFIIISFPPVISPNSTALSSNVHFTSGTVPEDREYKRIKTANDTIVTNTTPVPFHTFVSNDDTDSIPINITSTVPIPTTPTNVSPTWVTSFDPTNPIDPRQQQRQNTNLDPMQIEKPVINDQKREVDFFFSRASIFNIRAVMRYVNTLNVTDLPKPPSPTCDYPISLSSRPTDVSQVVKIVSKMQSYDTKNPKNDEYLKYMARQWNKLMHTINGNTDFRAMCLDVVEIEGQLPPISGSKPAKMLQFVPTHFKEEYPTIPINKDEVDINIDINALIDDVSPTNPIVIELDTIPPTPGTSEVSSDDDSKINISPIHVNPNKVKARNAYINYLTTISSMECVDVRYEDKVLHIAGKDGYYLLPEDFIDLNTCEHEHFKKQMDIKWYSTDSTRFINKFWSYLVKQHKQDDTEVKTEYSNFLDKWGCGNEAIRSDPLRVTKSNRATIDDKLSHNLNNNTLHQSEQKKKNDLSNRAKGKTQYVASHSSVYQSNEQDKSVPSATDLRKRLEYKRKFASKFTSTQNMVSWLIKSNNVHSCEFIREIYGFTTFFKSPSEKNDVYNVFLWEYINGSLLVECVANMLRWCDDASEFILSPHWSKYWYDNIGHEWMYEDYKIDLSTLVVNCNVKSPVYMGDYSRYLLEQAKSHNKVMHCTCGNIGFFLSHKAWNKLMHSLNGNVDFPFDMHDVENRVRIKDITATELSDMDLVTFASQISRQPSGYIGNNINVLHGSYISARRNLSNNTITNVPEQFFPQEILCQARAFYFAENSDDTLPATKRLSVNNTLLHNNKGIPMTTTVYGDMLMKQINSQGTLMLNRNTITTNGFMPVDMISFSCDETVNDFMGESAYMKWIAMSQIVLSRVQNTQANYLNFNQVELNDSLAHNSGTDIPIINGVNDSPIFGELCGGNACTFPFKVGGPLNNGGVIRFHVSLATVPADERPNVIAVPNWLLNVSNDPNLMMANMVNGIAPWPWCLFTFTLTTTPPLPDSPQRQTRYIDNMCTMIIDGEMIINILLPRIVGGKPPGTQNEANAMSAIIPQAGSRASANIAAFGAFNINFVGGVMQEYSLAEYLYTFIDDYSSGAFLDLMRAVTQITGDMEGYVEAWRKVSYLTTAYNPFRASIVGGNNRVNAMSDFFRCERNPDGMMRYRLQNNLPVSSSTIPAIMYVGQLRPRAWSKIMTGGWTLPPPPTEPLIPNYFQMTTSRYNMALTARALTIPFQIFYRRYSITNLMLNTVFSQTDLVAYRALIRGLYTGAPKLDHNVAFSPAKLGGLLENYFKCAMGWNLKLSPGTFSVFSSRLFPSVELSYQSCVNQFQNGFHDGVVVQLLSDIWFQTTVRNKNASTIAFSPFPPGFIKNGVRGIIPETYSEYLIGQSIRYAQWLPDKHKTPSIHSYDIYELDDEEIWNDRFIYHLFNCAYVVSLGDATNVPVPNVPPAQQTLFNFTSQLSPLVGAQVFTNMTCANTTWIPRINVNGITIFTNWSRLNAIDLNAYLTGVNIGYIDCWQMGSSLARESVITSNHPKLNMDDLFKSFPPPEGSASHKTEALELPLN